MERALIVAGTTRPRSIRTTVPASNAGLLPHEVAPQRELLGAAS
jgi:hypothetical protein